MTPDQEFVRKLQIIILTAFGLIHASCQPSAGYVPTGTLDPSATKTVLTILLVREVLVPLPPRTIPLDNCNGAVTLTVTSQAQQKTSIALQVQITASAEGQLLDIYKAQLALQLGVTEGKEESFTQDVSATLPVGTRALIQITWSEIWQEGFLVNEHGERTPFRARTGLQAAVDSQVTQPCTNITPTHLQAPSSTNTIVPSEIPAQLSPSLTPTLELTLPTATKMMQPTAAQIPVSLTPTLLPATTPILNATRTTTSVVVVQGYPCPAHIVSSEFSALNVVRARASNTAPLVRSVVPNAEVVIVAEHKVSGSTWYQIIYGSAQSSGWIPDKYVIPSTSCP